MAVVNVSGSKSLNSNWQSSCVTAHASIFLLGIESELEGMHSV
eukprot:IDg19839t1